MNRFPNIPDPAAIDKRAEVKTAQHDVAPEGFDPYISHNGKAQAECTPEHAVAEKAQAVTQEIYDRLFAGDQFQFCRAAWVAEE